MIPFSKTKFIAFLLLGLVFLQMGTVHALYVGPLPPTVIYADDFESYSLGQQLGPFGCLGKTGAALAGCLGGNGGWSYVDNATTTGGMANITSNNAYSGKQSLLTVSTNVAGGVFDVDKKIGLIANTTRLVSVSMWFAVSSSYGIELQNNAHLSFELYDRGNRYEAAMFLFSYRPVDGAQCAISAGIFPNFRGTTTLGSAGTDHFGPNGECFSLWNPSAQNARHGLWHHYSAIFNIATKQWVTAQIDGYDYTSVVCPGGVCLYFANHSGGGDSEYNGYYAQGVMRWEIGAQNTPGTWVSGTDIWYAWHDDLIITDVTSQPQPVIQFGISLFSGWFIVLMASVGVLYGTSGIGLVRRVILGKTEGMLQSYKMIVMTGLIATIGFIIILIVGALLTQQVCNSQHVATCSY